MATNQVAGPMLSALGDVWTGKQLFDKDGPASEVMKALTGTCFSAQHHKRGADRFSLVVSNDERPWECGEEIFEAGPSRQALDGLMQRLFQLHDLRGCGKLTAEDLVELNQRVAKLHYGPDADQEAVREKYEALFLEHLDPEGRPVSYSIFRDYMGSVLEQLDDDLLAQTMILEQFIAEAESALACFPYDEHTDDSTTDGGMPGSANITGDISRDSMSLSGPDEFMLDDYAWAWDGGTAGTQAPVELQFRQPVPKQRAKRPPQVEPVRKPVERVRLAAFERRMPGPASFVAAPPTAQEPSTSSRRPSAVLKQEEPSTSSRRPSAVIKQEDVCIPSAALSMQPPLQQELQSQQFVPQQQRQLEQQQLQLQQLLGPPVTRAAQASAPPGAAVGIPRPVTPVSACQPSSSRDLPRSLGIPSTATPPPLSSSGIVTRRAVVRYTSPASLPVVAAPKVLSSQPQKQDSSGSTSTPWRVVPGTGKSALDGSSRTSNVPEAPAPATQAAPAGIIQATTPRGTASGRLHDDLAAGLQRNGPEVGHVLHSLPPATA